LGTVGVISCDYEQAAYNRITMSSLGSKDSFKDENTTVKRAFTNASNIRAGLEMNLTNEFSLRGGYAFYGNPERDYGECTQIASLGLGLHFSSFFSDLTYMQRFAQKERFSLYDDITEGSQIFISAPVGTQTMSSWKLLLSIGFRF
jgi:long-subunit fatty acid transport protein